MALQSQGMEVFWSTSTAASTSTAVRVGQVRTFNGPGGQSADIDVSHLKSTAHEYLQGLPDDGDFALSVWFDPTSAAEGHKQLMEDRYARVKRKCVIKFNDASSSLMMFDAFCKTVVLSGAVDGAIGADVSFKITGGATLATAIA